MSLLGLCSKTRLGSDWSRKSSAPPDGQALTGRSWGSEEWVSQRHSHPQPPVPIKSNSVARAGVGDGSWQMLCCQKVLLAPLMGTRLHPASREVGSEKPRRCE